LARETDIEAANTAGNNTSTKRSKAGSPYYLSAGIGNYFWATEVVIHYVIELVVTN
jgi:hypothetical protein